MVKYFRPLASDASLGGVGLRRFDIESIVAGNAPYDTRNPATAVPVVGTENWGLPRDGVRLSLTGSHVQIDGWRLKSVNHSQAVNISGATSSSTRALTNARFFTRESAFTTHLGCTMLLQQFFRCPRLFGRTFHPDPIVTMAEARIVTHHHRDAGNARADEESGHRRQSSDQHHHFETKDGIRDPRRDRFSADDQWPPVRYPDRDPVAEGATE